MHDRAMLGTAVLCHYRPFLQNLVHCVMTSCAGGPDLARYEHEQCLGSSTTNKCLTSGICVGVSEVRSCPRYPIHKDKDVTECRQSFVSGSHGSQRTDGIFTWFCRHGICYGFYIIPNAEGRNEAFSFLLKHFKVAPKVVVYDFACAL